MHNKNEMVHVKPMLQTYINNCNIIATKGSETNKICEK